MSLIKTWIALGLLGLCLLVAPFSHAWHFDHGYAFQYTMVHNVTIHEAPGESSVVLDRVPQGTQLTIVKPSERDGWIKIHYSPLDVAQGQTKEGYVHQAYLSSRWEAFPDPENPGRNLLLLVAFNHDNASTQANASIIKDGKFVANKDFMVVNAVEEPIYPELSLLKETGLPDNLLVFELKMAPQACGVSGEGVLLIWDGETLTLGPRGHTIVEAGVFHELYDFILPNHTGGQKDAVIVKKTYETWDEAKEDYRIEKIDHEVFHWNGSQFALQAQKSKCAKP